MTLPPSETSLRVGHYHARRRARERYRHRLLSIVAAFASSALFSCVLTFVQVT